MSFKLSVSPDFSALINAEIPGDNGKSQKISFHVRFKRFTASEYDALIKRLQPDQDGSRGFTDQDLVDDVLVGFGDDLLDDNGNVLAFTPDNVAALCDVIPIRSIIVQAFFDNHFKAKAKN